MITIPAWALIAILAITLAFIGLFLVTLAAYEHKKHDYERSVDMLYVTQCELVRQKQTQPILTPEPKVKPAINTKAGPFGFNIHYAADAASEEPKQ